jgi:hypothetical protein
METGRREMEAAGVEVAAAAVATTHKLLIVISSPSSLARHGPGRTAVAADGRRRN